MLPLITVPNPNPNAVSNHPTNLPGPIVSNITTGNDPWKATSVKIVPTDANPTSYSMFYQANANGYSYKQIIKILDTQKPVIESCLGSDTLKIGDQTNNDAQFWNAGYWFDPLLLSFDLCEAPSDISLTASDDCSLENVTFKYQLFLDLDANNARETVISSDNLPPASTVMFNNVVGQGEARQFDFRPVQADQKYRFALKQEIVNGKKRASVSFNTSGTPDVHVAPQLPFGNHKIKWTVSDQCGNETVCEYPILIRDGKAPTVSCASGVTINMTPDKMVSLQANDLFQFATDNCTPSQFLQKGIKKSSVGGGFPVDGMGNPVTSITFDCAELGQHVVEIWCRDKMDNAGFCTAMVTVADNSNNCVSNPTPVLYGYARTVLNEPMADVEVELVFPPPLPFLPFIKLTDSMGYYGFPANTPFFNNNVLEPTHDILPLNGVTTFDLVLISKHILGIEALGSPYKMIAADANKSNSITTFDIVELRKMLQGITDELLNNRSWRFVPESYVFPNPAAPFQPQFPEVISLANFNPATFDGDFIGIKIGDVNLTAEVDARGTFDDRSAGVLPFEVAFEQEHQEVGSVFDLHFTGVKDLLGCQFTLDHQGLEIIDVLPGQEMSREQFALFPDKKALTVVWETGGQPTFSLKCRATNPGNVREMVTLGSRITKAEAYRGSLAAAERYDLRLQFPEMNTFELFQNQPNPFSSSTSVLFNLPEAGDATLKVMDASGKLLYRETRNFDKGLNTFTLQKTALGATGVLYYQVETATHQGIRKMTVLD
jgi:hypothetical protein